MRERRLRLSKIGNVGLWTAVLLGLLVVGGSTISRSMIAWLHAQDAYKLSYSDIELDPAPPKWIKGGRLGILEEVRGGRPPTLFATDLDLENVLTDFKRLPWVSAAPRAIKAYPNKVKISLVYREPVARIRFRKSSEVYFVDEHSVVLPEDDIDFDKAGRLLDIWAEAPREVPKPGIAWPGDGEAASKNVKWNPQTRVAVAASLAGALKAKTAEYDGETKPLFLPASVVADHNDAIFVRLANGTLVLWSLLAASPAPVGPTEYQKWAWLVEKSKSETGLVLKLPVYLDLSGDKPVLSQFGNK